MVAESGCILKDNTDPPIDEKVMPWPLMLLLLEDSPAITREVEKLGKSVGVGVGVGDGSGCT